MSNNDFRKQCRNPLELSNYVSVQHVERYHFACERLSGWSRVLDVACGTGYGTMMLRRQGMDVVGADVDREQIGHNRERWNYKDFVAADVRELPFRSASFDAVVSFETIEHVPEPAPYMTEICRVLKKEGTFICSTPKKLYTSHPSYHIKEYMPHEFFSLLNLYFADVRKFGQYFRARDRLADVLRKKPRKIAGLITETLRIKEKLKRCLSYILRKSAVENIPERMPIDIIPEQGDSDFGSYYRVREYDGSHLLRIMVAVSENKLE